MTDKNEFLSIPKAAEKCGVDRRTMRRWVKSKT
jgi:predicted DNA-binding transcriptional regulator AlpA